MICHYFVDEAGDLTLFGRRAKVLVGTPGCSRYFMLGVAQIADLDKLARDIDGLRAKLLADPYFKSVPSMQFSAGKTAVQFHAKNDLPEVRREVFALLRKIPAKVQVVVRRKRVLVEFARSTGVRLGANAIYDDLAKRLFRNLLHKADENHIVFAWRGKTNRRDALRDAINKAKTNFERKYGMPSDRPTSIEVGTPRAHPGLQLIDYYLWALQRLYERREDRFFELLRPGYRLIMDIDDKRNNDYGEYYSDSNPFELRKIK